MTPPEATRGRKPKTGRDWRYRPVGFVAGAAVLSLGFAASGVLYLDVTLG